MSVGTPTASHLLPVSAAGADPLALRSLQRQMLQQTCAASSPSDLCDSLLELLAVHMNVLAGSYVGRNAQGELCEPHRLLTPVAEAQSERLSKQLQAACQSALRSGETEVRRQLSPPRTTLATPVPFMGRNPEAFALVVQSDLPAEQLVLLVQMVASHLVLWYTLAATRHGEANTQQATALVELLERVMQAPDLRNACYTLAGELNTFLGTERVAIGLQPTKISRCRLTAISGMAQFDTRSPAAAVMEAAMEEALLRKDVTRWPIADEQQRHAALAHKNLCALEEVTAVASIPLYNHEGNAVGVIQVFDAADAKLTAATQFLEAAAQPLAVSLASAARSEGGRCARTIRTIGRSLRCTTGKVALAGAAVVAAAMFIPVQHKIHCDCTLEPVTRRYVAAPFESSLEKAMVKPGDLVKEGELLAQLDGREIRWKRAGVEADRQQAVKRRDTAQATHSYADQQIARLEIQRLELELQLLDHRAQNLEIRSPLAGIVTSGDLERAEGAPLTIGQTLFEIAPLQTMVVEVAIADDEVAHVTAGLPIEIRLDAYPARHWEAVAGKIQPRSEIRDSHNVFIAEVPLDNTDGNLRPGMRGRARIAAGRQPLAWILFHKPWEYAVKRLSW